MSRRKPTPTRRKLPYMRLYWQDYRADTGHLSCIEHGAYLLITCWYWERQRAPTEAEAKGASLMPTEAWQESRNTLASFFKIDSNGVWKHGRIDAELDRTRKLSKKLRNNASKGGKTTAERRKAALAAAIAAASAQATTYNADPTGDVQGTVFSGRRSNGEGLDSLPHHERRSAFHQRRARELRLEAKVRAKAEQEAQARSEQNIVPFDSAERGTP